MLNFDIEQIELIKLSEKYTQIVADAKDFVWSNPELLFKEFKCSQYLADALKNNGFHVQKPVAGCETAFLGKVVCGDEPRVKIGFMLEYDALPGLVQDPVTYKSPETKTKPGHGCQHALLGAGALGAAISLKSFAEKKNLPVEITAFGTPAEEGGGGKLLFANAGLFNGYDLILTWHPYDKTRAWIESSLAVIAAEIEFYGRTAHAALSPWEGRSALDSAMLCLNGIEFMREHMPTTSRIHYIIENGGLAPNIVPDFAKIKLQVRATKMTDAKKHLEDIKIIATSADKMSWRSWHRDASKGYKAPKMKINIGFHELNSNRTASFKLQEILENLGAVDFDVKDQEIARELQRNFGTEEKGLSKIVTPLVPEPEPLAGSTDVGDTSWLAPTAQIWSTTVPEGIALHTWPVTAAGMMPSAIKGTMLAVKTLALTALEVIRDKNLRENIKQEFSESRKDVKWEFMMNQEFLKGFAA